MPKKQAAEEDEESPEEAEAEAAETEEWIARLKNEFSDIPAESGYELLSSLQALFATIKSTIFYYRDERSLPVCTSWPNPPNMARMLRAQESRNQMIRRFVEEGEREQTMSDIRNTMSDFTGVSHGSEEWPLRTIAGLRPPKDKRRAEEVFVTSDKGAEMNIVSVPIAVYIPLDYCNSPLWIKFFEFATRNVTALNRIISFAIQLADSARAAQLLSGIFKAPSGGALLLSVFLAVAEFLLTGSGFSISDTDEYAKFIKAVKDLKFLIDSFDTDPERPPTPAERQLATDVTTPLKLGLTMIDIVEDRQNDILSNTTIEGTFSTRVPGTPELDRMRPRFADTNFKATKFVERADGPIPFMFYVLETTVASTTPRNGHTEIVLVDPIPEIFSGSILAGVRITVDGGRLAEYVNTIKAWFELGPTYRQEILNLILPPDDSRLKGYEPNEAMEGFVQESKPVAQFWKLHPRLDKEEVKVFKIIEGSDPVAYASVSETVSIELFADRAKLVNRVFARAKMPEEDAERALRWTPDPVEDEPVIRVIAKLNNFNSGPPEPRASTDAAVASVAEDEGAAEAAVVVDRVVALEADAVDAVEEAKLAEVRRWVQNSPFFLSESKRSQLLAYYEETNYGGERGLWECVAKLVYDSEGSAEEVLKYYLRFLRTNYRETRLLRVEAEVPATPAAPSYVEDHYKVEISVGADRPEFWFALKRMFSAALQDIIVPDRPRAQDYTEPYETAILELTAQYKRSKNMRGTVVQGSPERVQARFLAELGEFFSKDDVFNEGRLLKVGPNAHIEYLNGEQPWGTLQDAEAIIALYGLGTTSSGYARKIFFDNPPDFKVNVKAKADVTLRDLNGTKHLIEYDPSTGSFKLFMTGEGQTQKALESFIAPDSDGEVEADDSSVVSETEGAPTTARAKARAEEELERQDAFSSVTPAMRYLTEHATELFKVDGPFNLLEFDNNFAFPSAAELLFVWSRDREQYDSKVAAMLDLLGGRGEDSLEEDDIDEDGVLDADSGSKSDSSPVALDPEEAAAAAALDEDDPDGAAERAKARAAAARAKAELERRRRRLDKITREEPEFTTKAALAAAAAAAKAEPAAAEAAEKAAAEAELDEEDPAGAKERAKARAAKAAKAAAKAAAEAELEAEAERELEALVAAAAEQEFEVLAEELQPPFKNLDPGDEYFRDVVRLAKMLYHSATSASIRRFNLACNEITRGIFAFPKNRSSPAEHKGCLIFTETLWAVAAAAAAAEAAAAAAAEEEDDVNELITYHRLSRLHATLTEGGFNEGELPDGYNKDWIIRNVARVLVLPRRQKRGVSGIRFEFEERPGEQFEFNSQYLENTSFVRALSSSTANSDALRLIARGDAAADEAGYWPALGEPIKNLLWAKWRSVCILPYIDDERFDPNIVHGFVLDVVGVLNLCPKKGGNRTRNPWTLDEFKKTLLPVVERWYGIFDSASILDCASNIVARWIRIFDPSAEMESLIVVCESVVQPDPLAQPGDKRSREAGTGGRLAAGGGSIIVL